MPADASAEEERRQLLVERRVVRLLHTYARAVDRQDWSLLESVFHPDATDDHGPYKGDVAGLIAFLGVEMAAVDSATHADRVVVVDRSRIDPVARGADLAQAFVRGAAGPADPSHR